MKGGLSAAITVLLVLLFAAAPASAGLWADGQLHTHSTECGHDGAPETPDGSVGKMIDRAKSKGLEYIAISDNNPLCPPNRTEGRDMSNFVLIPAVESYPAKGVAVVGRDAGESKGHMNAFKVQSHIDSVRDLTTAADAAALYHNEGGIVQVNHPFSTLQPFTDLSWYLGWDFPFEDIEVVNVNWNIPPGAGAKSFAKWRELLASGRHITGVAVSDYHMDKQWLGFIHNLDAPYTAVYADNLTVDGVIAGLKAGRAYTIADHDRSRAVLEADANSDGTYEAMIGDTVTVPYGQKVKFRVTVTGGSTSDDLEVWDKSGKIIDVDIKSMPFTYTFETTGTVDNFYLVKVEGPWWRAYEAQSITNPIWVKVDGAGTTEETPSGLTVITGGIGAGSFNSVLADDGSYLQLDEANVGSVLWPEYDQDSRFTFDLQVSNISRIDVKTDAWKDDDSPQIQRFNYTSNAWEFIGSVKDSGSDPGLYTLNVCTNGKCANYVSSGQVQVRFRYDSGAPSNNDWIRIDYLALVVQSTPSFGDPLPVQASAQSSALSTPKAVIAGGNLASTYVLDGNILQLNEKEVGFTEYDLDAQFTFQLSLAAGATVNKLRVDTDAWGYDDVVALRVYNYNTASWVSVSNIVLGSGQPSRYILAVCSTSATCAPYVSGGQAKLQLWHDSGAFSNQDWAKVDYLRLLADVTVPPPADTAAPAVGTPEFDEAAGVFRASVSDIGGSGLNTNTCEASTGGSWFTALFDGASCYLDKASVSLPSFPSLTDLSFRIKDLANNLGTGSALSLTIPNSFHQDELSITQLWSTPISGVPLLNVGAGVKVTAVNVTGAWQQWSVNVSADRVEITPVAGAGVAGFRIVEVSGGVALIITDPDVSVAVESGNLVYKVSMGGIDAGTRPIVLSVLGQELLRVSVPDWQTHLVDGASLQGVIALTTSIAPSTLTSNSTSLSFNWQPVAGAVQYSVLQATDKLNTAAASIINTTQTVFSDALDGAAQSFYWIRPVDGSGVAGPSTSVISKVKRTFTYQPGKTNLFWVSVPYGSKLSKASDIVAAIEPLGGNSKISMVAKWDPATQSTVGYGYVPGVGWMGTDFPIAPGDGLYLYLSGKTAAFDWTLLDVEASKARAFTYQPGKTNLHWVSVPFAAKYGKASDIVAAIEPLGGNSKISMVAKWDPATQSTVGYGYVPGVGWMGTDFPIAPGDGLYLYLSGKSASFTWLPDLVMA